MSDKQDIMYELLAEMDALTVMRLITNYHGMQLLDDGFYKFLQDEGFIENDNEDDMKEDENE